MKPNDDEYDAMAQFYDQMIEWDSRLNRELPFLQGYFETGMNLIDFGCSTGRHAIALAKEHNAEVVGVDISPKMIVQAKAIAKKQQVEDRVDFITSNLIELGLNIGPFEGGYILGNTIANLGNRDNIIKFFKKARKLIPEGYLIGQSVYLSNQINYLPLNVVMDENHEVIIQRIMIPLGNNQSTHQLHFNVINKERNNYIKQKVHFLYTITPSNLEQICNETSWKLKEIYSNYEKESVKDKSGEALVWVLE